MIELDHAILVVADLDAAAARLRSEYGLESVFGGRHTGHGTGNRIVPLGDRYLELMGVLDEQEAATSAMGRWALERAAEPFGPVAVCLRTDDIDSVAVALGEEPVAMSRVREDGVTLPWRLAGLAGMLGPERRPFFMQWEVAPGDHPGATAITHPAGEVRLAGAEIAPVPALSDLLAYAAGLTFSDGPPGVHRVTLTTPSGSVTLARD